MEIVHVYSKARREFGRSVGHFADTQVELVWDQLQNEDMLTEFVERNPTSTAVQCCPEMSEHEINTERFELRSEGVLHQEGGWPKEVDTSEVEQLVRFRKKVEKDEHYIKTIKSLGGTLEHALLQNNSIDIYEEYFDSQFVDHSEEPPAARTLAVFRDPCTPRRTATCISWFPDQARKVAVSYAILQFQKQPEGMSTSSYIWDVNNPNFPELEITPASALCSLEFNPKDPHILIGGCYNGLLQVWDERKGSAPVDSSPIEKSHRDPVYEVAWLQSKTGTECASISTDGQLLWWDIRKLGEPVESLMLDPKGDGMVLGGVSLEYDPAGGPTKFLVGTEQGVAIMCNRKAKTPADHIGALYPGHHGPIYSLQRNPFFPKYFMTVGDWTARIWMEDLKTPIMTTKYDTSYLTDGCWSPTRPGVFFTTKLDGTMDIWDYFYKQNIPTLSLQVTDKSLHTLRVEQSGRLIAIGSVDGATTLFQISESLSVMQQNEKQGISQMLERETRRERNLQDMEKKKARERGRESKQAAASRTEKDDGDEERLKEVEKEFFEMVLQGEELSETKSG